MPQPIDVLGGVSSSALGAVPSVVGSHVGCVGVGGLSLSSSFGLVDLIDETPRKSPLSVDRLSGQGEGRDALAPDAVREADGSARSGDESQAHFGQSDQRCCVGGDRSGECGHLDSTSEGPAVDLHGGAIAQPVEKARWALRQPNSMCESGIGATTEFGEVAAAAKRRPTTRNADGPDRVIGDRESESVAQRIA